MNDRLSFRPNLVDCILEQRVAPAIANLATVILTTNGLILIEAFPGANSSGAGSLGASSSGGGTASSVSGAAVPTSLYITGTGGISSLKPGNITGVPSLAGGATGASGISLSIQIGSGADTSDGPTISVSAGGTTNNVVGLATVADPTANPTITVIGGNSNGSGSPVLPPGQSYRDNAPVQSTMGSTSTLPPPTMNGTGGSGSMGGNQYAPNPQMGAPTLGPSGLNRGGMINPIQGSLVPVTPMLPGNN
jgi:hypothetical protein